MCDLTMVESYEVINGDEITQATTSAVYPSSLFVTGGGS